MEYVVIPQKAPLIWRQKNKEKLVEKQKVKLVRFAAQSEMDGVIKK